MMERRRTRGLTITEVVVSLAVVVTITSILFAAGFGDGQQDRVAASMQEHARLLEDQSQLRIVHQAMAVFSNEDREQRYPMPGLVHRLDWDPGDGGGARPVPGRGEMDVAKNTTANLYSALIAQNYFGTKLPVGPTEPNAVVKVKTDYNYQSYNPIPPNVTYWDPTFVANLESGSNASYAHTPMVGQRAKLQWRNTMDATFASIGNRGVKDGVRPSDESYAKSKTLKIHGPRDQWAGNLCFNDNHVEYQTTFRPDHAVYEFEGTKHQDNIFRADEDSTKAKDADMWLTFTQIVLSNVEGRARVVVQYD